MGETEVAVGTEANVQVGAIKTQIEDQVLKVPFGNETRKIRYAVIRYCVGLGLDLGCGGEKIDQRAIGIDAQSSAANLKMDFGDLRIFSSDVFDYVYSSHAIEDVYYPEPVLREWWRVLKPNGHLVLAFPNWRLYKDDEKECNLDHSKHLEGRDVRRMMEKFAHAEVVKQEDIDRSQVLVLRKLSSRSKGGIKKKTEVRPEKSVCVVRYGAYGDGIIIMPVLRKLKEEGYHVTLNCSEYCKPVFDNCPYVDELIVHPRDCIPNKDNQLQEYWQYLAKGFDKFINLSGTLEGDLLLPEGQYPMGCDVHTACYMPGCHQCETMKEARDRNIGGVNYYDYTMAKAGFPELKGTRGELFFSHGELVRARDLARKWRRRNQFVVIWSLSGSSYHKAYPYWGSVAVEFARHHPDVVIYSVGGFDEKYAEVDHPQIKKKCGEWPIRMSMCLTQFADLVIGAETGVLHAAACYDTEKIVLLSHSSADNLTKHWTNVQALEPDRNKIPCYPCHQLHYRKESCPLKPFPTIWHDGDYGPLMVADPPADESQFWPVCMVEGISLSRVLEAMEKSYKRVRAARNV